MSNERWNGNMARKAALLTVKKLLKISALISAKTVSKETIVIINWANSKLDLISKIKNWS